MDINARDWLNDEERELWDACGTKGIEVNVTVSVAKDIRKEASSEPFKAASGALGLVKGVLGRGPVRMLLARVSKYRSHYLDRHLKFHEARDKLWELRQVLGKASVGAVSEEEFAEVRDDLDRFMSKLSSEWKAGATLEEGMANSKAEEPK